MKEIIVWAIFSGLLFLAFIFVLVRAFLKQRLQMAILSFGLVLASMATTLYTGYLISRRSYTHTILGRSGEEIYVSLFGMSKSCYASIHEYQDRVVPRVDYGIWLHYTTCPKEFDRILTLHTYHIDTADTKGWNTSGPQSDQDWFKPEKLGDRILIYEWEQDGERSEQKIFVNLARTEAYLIDVKN